MNESIAIITGASSGVGREFALQLDQSTEFNEFWLIAQDMEGLEATAAKLKHESKLFAGDLTSETFEDELFTELEAKQPLVKILVNSAGVGFNSKFKETSLEANTLTLDLNIRALTRLTYKVLDYMAKGSRVFNIASVSSFMPQYKFSVYSASKAYVLSFSRALNSEVKSQGINVIAVCPNPLETNFKHGEKIKGIKRLGIEDVSTVVRTAIENSHYKKDISVQSLLAHIIRFISRILPHNWVLNVEAFLDKFNQD